MINIKKILKVEVFDSSKERILISDKITIQMTADMANEVIILQEPNNAQLSMGTSVSAVINYTNGDRIKYMGSVDLCTDYQLNIALISEGKKLEERRRCFKQDTNLTASFKIIRHNDSTIILDNPVKCTIANINTGGVFLKTSYEMHYHDVLAIAFNIPEKKISCNLRILRVDRSKDNEIIGYGCEFIGLKMKDEESIARYVTMLQRELLNKRKQQIEKMN